MAFNPDWTVAPGDTLAEWMKENGFSRRVFAKASGLDADVLDGLLDGSLMLTAVIADRLQHATGITAKFWIAYEEHYRADLAAGRTRI
jgi:plasmid maintenance system antidote protein VapI